MLWYDRKYFDEYFDLVSKFEENNIFSHDIRNKKIYTYKNIKTYLLQLDEFNEELFKTTYLKNLYSFLIIKKLILNPEKHRKSFSPIIEKKILSRVAENSDFMPSRLYGSPSSSYLHFLTSEFKQYLFSDKRFESEKLERIKKNISKILDIYSEIEEDSRSIGNGDNILGGRYFEYHKKTIERKSNLINNESFKSNYREVNFAKNLIKFNLEVYKKPRISFVLDLMCLPFFERKLDVRTLNRIRSKLQGHI